MSAYQNMATVETLRTAYSPKLNRDVRLIVSSGGYEVAGSGTRWTTGYYAVRWNLDGATHGKRYLSLEGAQAHFQRLTQS